MQDHNHFSQRVVPQEMLDMKNVSFTIRQKDIMGTLDQDIHLLRYLLQMVDTYHRNRALLHETQEGCNG